MPFQLLPQQQAGFGANFGTGLGNSISALAELKFKDLSEQHTAKKTYQDLKAAHPYEDEAKLRLAAKDPLFRKEFYKQQNNLGQTGEGLELIIPELNKDEATKIGKLSKGVQNLWYKEYQNSPQQAIDRLKRFPEKPKTKDITNFAKDIHASSIQPQQQMQTIPGSQLNSPENQALMEQLGITREQLQAQPQLQPQVQEAIQPMLQPEQQPVSPQVKQLTPAETIKNLQEQLKEEKPKNVSDLIKEDPSLTKDEAKDIVKSEHKSRQERIKKADLFKDNIYGLDELGDFSNKRLGQMKTLITKEGGLPIAAIYNLYDNLERKVHPEQAALAGGTLGGLTTQGGWKGAAIGSIAGALISPIAGVLKDMQKVSSPNTERFEKLSADFVRDAKSIFGSRITDADLQAFLKMIPTLSNTDSGKLSIIENMEAFNKYNKIRANTARQIIKANKGRTPENLEALVFEMTKPELDKLADDFKSVFNEAKEWTQPKSENPILNTLATGQLGI